LSVVVACGIIFGDEKISVLVVVVVVVVVFVGNKHRF
jgi:hypothetical protein